MAQVLQYDPTTQFAGISSARPGNLEFGSVSLPARPNAADCFSADWGKGAQTVISFAPSFLLNSKSFVSNVTTPVLSSILSRLAHASPAILHSSS